MTLCSVHLAIQVDSDKCIHKVKGGEMQMRTLTVKQRNVLKEWYDEHKEEIHYIFEGLPDALYDELKRINDSEILTQEAERYIEDRLADEGY